MDVIQSDIDQFPEDLWNDVRQISAKIFVKRNDVVTKNFTDVELSNSVGDRGIFVKFKF